MTEQARDSHGRWAGGAEGAARNSGSRYGACGLQSLHQQRGATSVGKSACIRTESMQANAKLTRSRCGQPGATANLWTEGTMTKATKQVIEQKLSRLRCSARDKGHRCEAQRQAQR